MERGRGREAGRGGEGVGGEGERKGEGEVGEEAEKGMDGITHRISLHWSEFLAVRILQASISPEKIITNRAESYGRFILGEYIELMSLSLPDVADFLQSCKMKSGIEGLGTRLGPPPLYKTRIPTGYEIHQFC